MSSSTAQLAWRASRGLPSAEALAKRPHATRLRYLSGCRCMLCRAAASRYECERAAARKRGQWNGLVPASPARHHLDVLSRAGVGFKSVAAAASVGKSIVWLIRTGRRSRIRAETARRILAVDRKAVAGGALIPAKATWRRIRILLEEGFSKAELARRLGYRHAGLQFNRWRITARNAARVERFYNRMME